MTFLEFDRLSPTLSSLRSDIPPHKGEGIIPRSSSFRRTPESSFLVSRCKLDPGLRRGDEGGIPGSSPGTVMTVFLEERYGCVYRVPV